MANRRFIIYDVEHDRYFVHGALLEIPKGIKLYTKTMALKKCQEQIAKGHMCEVYSVHTVIDRLSIEIKETYNCIKKGVLPLEDYQIIKDKTLQLIELQYPVLRERRAETIAVKD